MMNLKNILLRLRKKRKSNMDSSSKMFLAIAFLSFFIAIGSKQSCDALEINKNDIVIEQDMPDFFNVTFHSGLYSKEMVATKEHILKGCRDASIQLFDYYESIEQKVKHQRELEAMQQEREIRQQQFEYDRAVEQYVLETYQFSSSELDTFVNLLLANSRNAKFHFSNRHDVIYYLYEIANISNEEKLLYIFEHHQITESELIEVNAVVHGEAKGDGTCYVDAYAVINSMHNRTQSVIWRNANGASLYSQVIQPGQYQPYYEGTYLKYLNDNDSLCYQAVLDFLYSEASIHNYLNFRSSYRSRATDVNFVSGGNYFHNVMTDPVEDYVRFLSRD